MNTFVGFVFTESPIEDLRRRGFSLQRDDSNLKSGYRSFYLVFDSSSCFEIREILDEQLYLKTFQIEHFQPFVTQSGQALAAVSNVNTVVGYRDLLSLEKIESGELQTFLQIRKVFPLWALWLQCENFEKFCQSSHPDRVFQWKGQPVAVIHLGPNCFDLLVSP